PPRATTVACVPWARNELGALTGLKTTSYADNVVAITAARRVGATEAILPNTAGALCEGTGSNVFVVVDGVVRTPSLRGGPPAGRGRPRAGGRVAARGGGRGGGGDPADVGPRPGGRGVDQLQRARRLRGEPGRGDGAGHDRRRSDAARPSRRAARAGGRPGAP